MLEFLGILFLLAAIGVGLYFLYKLMIKTRSEPNDGERGSVTNIFEHGVCLCEDEIFVRGYNCAELKSVFLRKIKAQGVLAITNKRVIFHTIGYRDNVDFIHHEVPVQDVSAVTVQTGVMADLTNMITKGVFSSIATGKAKRKIFFLDIHAKGASGEHGAITVAPTDSKGMDIVLPSYDMIPTGIVVDMANEIGAIINDIQMGVDIEKWM